MLPVLVAMTLISLAAAAGSSALMKGSSSQGGGGKRHTRKHAKKLGKSRKRR